MPSRHTPPIGLQLTRTARVAAQAFDRALGRGGRLRGRLAGPGARPLRPVGAAVGDGRRDGRHERDAHPPPQRARAQRARAPLARGEQPARAAGGADGRWRRRCSTACARWRCATTPGCAPASPRQSSRPSPRCSTACARSSRRATRARGRARRLSPPLAQRLELGPGMRAGIRLRGSRAARTAAASSRTPAGIAGSLSCA